jgi:Cell Wall Hydrolase
MLRKGRSIGGLHVSGMIRRRICCSADTGCARKASFGASQFDNGSAACEWAFPVSVPKDIEALARTSAVAHAGAMSVQTSHNDASVMIGSAERALAELRSDLAAPYRPSLAKPAARVSEPRRATGVKHTLRWLGVFAAGMCAAGLSAIFFWPTGNGSASNGGHAPIVEQAAAESLLDDPSTLQRPSATDAVSRMYAAEFGRTDTANLRCLAEAVYFEARGEPYIGQVAVAQVVLNRARSGKWPRGVCAVIAQGVERGEKCQFSYMCKTTRATPVGPRVVLHM